MWEPHLMVGSEHEHEGFTHKVTDDMAEHLEGCFTYMESVVGGWTAPKLWLSEIRCPINIGPVDEEGTADVIAVLVDEQGLCTIHVFDLKYGRGVRVSAPGNEQLLMYALGVVQLLGGPMFRLRIKAVLMHIMQPRVSDGFTVWELDAQGMSDWTAALATAAAEALDPERRTFRPSEKACRWCPLSGSCAAQAQATIEKIAPGYDINLQGVGGMRVQPEREVVNKPHLLSAHQLATLLLDADFLIDTIKGWRAYARECILRGERIPGWSLDEREGNSRWQDNDEAQIAQYLKGLGMPHDEVWREQAPKLATLTEARGYAKRTTKNDPAQRALILKTIDDMTTKTTGETVLVQDSEVRGSPIQAGASLSETIGFKVNNK